MEEFLKDLRYGARTLSKSAGFTLIAVITIGLGIGANTAIFSVVNSVLLKTLPYPEPDRVVRAAWRWSSGETPNVTAIEYQFWKENSRSFLEAAAYTYTGSGYNLKGGAEPLRVSGQPVSEAFFRVLGVSPAIGRTFTKEEDLPNGPRAAVISDGLWHSNFGGDSDIMGRQVELNGLSWTIVGVMPAGFQFENPMDVFIPLRLLPDPTDNGHNTDMIARLNPGVTLRQAQAEMDQLFPQFRAQYPKGSGPAERGIRLLTLQDSLVDAIRSNLLLLFGAVAFVLLIACANVANLLLARASYRRGEMAVRVALGAGRMRLIRQLMTENLLLALTGSVVGVILAYSIVPVLLAINPDGLPRSSEIGVDLRAVLFALFAAGVTSFLVGAPAIQATRLDINNLLKSASGRAGTAKPGARGRALLMISEVALSLVLLAGAALLIRSFIKLNSVDLGFDPKNLTAMQISLNSAKYRSTASVTDLEQRINERIAAVPGVVSVAAAPGLPMEGTLNNYMVVDGRAQDSGQSIESRAITHDYFRTIGIPLFGGRAFSDSDTASSLPVAVINERLAKMFWPQENPIGARVTLGSTHLQIVGIVGNIKEKGLDSREFPTIYRPIAQIGDSGTVATNAWFPTSWLIRTAGPLDLKPTLRGLVKDIDPGLPIARIRPMTEVISGSITDQRFLMVLMTAFAGLALVLTIVGLYGVISYQVSQRTQEIGIRVALGARAMNIVKLVVGHGMILTIVGVTIGLAASYWLTRLLSTLLFGVSATDPITFVFISALLLLVGLLACLVPARRALKVDPMVALKYE